MDKHTPEIKRRGSSRRSSDTSSKSIESRVLQKNFTSMYKTVVGGEVPEELFARGIIDQTTLEFTMKPTNTEREKGHRVMHELMRAVEVKPDLFEEICSILEAESTEPPREVARNLRSKWLTSASPSRPTYMIDHAVIGVNCHMSRSCIHVMTVCVGHTSHDTTLYGNPPENNQTGLCDSKYS